MAKALTRALIEAADPDFTEEALASWVALIRQSSFYQQSRTLFDNLTGQLTNAPAIVKKQLNAVMDQIEALGLQDVSIEGDTDAAHFSITANRDAWIGYALSVLYDISVDLIGAGGVGGRVRATSQVLKSRPEW